MHACVPSFYVYEPYRKTTNFQHQRKNLKHFVYIYFFGAVYFFTNFAAIWNEKNHKKSIVIWHFSAMVFFCFNISFFHSEKSAKTTFVCYSKKCCLLKNRNIKPKMRKGHLSLDQQFLFFPNN
jgi:hypothetical protein